MGMVLIELPINKPIPVKTITTGTIVVSDILVKDKMAA